MPTTYAPEAATIQELLSAVKVQLADTTTVPSSKIFVTFSDDLKPAPVKERHITVRVSNPYPDSFGGAGRRSTRVKRTLIISLFTRMNLDQIRRNDIWYLKATSGHYNIEDAVIDSFHVRYLFSPAPESRRLTVLPLHWIEGYDPPNTPTPEPGWGRSILAFQMEYVQKLSLDLSLGE